MHVKCTLGVYDAYGAWLAGGEGQLGLGMAEQVVRVPRYSRVDGLGLSRHRGKCRPCYQFLTIKYYCWNNAVAKGKATVQCPLEIQMPPLLSQFSMFMGVLYDNVPCWEHLVSASVFVSTETW